MIFSDAYVDLLILQYKDQPNAEAEIRAKADRFNQIFETAKGFLSGFDVDTAVGKQLDIIGVIVGMPRSVSQGTKISFFGFSDNPASTRMGLKFTSTPDVLYPMRDKFGLIYTPTFLTDADYRRFIKLKIFKNTCQMLISSGVKAGIQEAVAVALNSNAVVIDNRNMSLTIYVDAAVSNEEILIMSELDLVPRPQGIEITFVRDPVFLQTFTRF